MDSQEDIDKVYTLDYFDRTKIYGYICWNLEEGATAITTNKIRMFLQIMLSNLSWESYMRKTQILFLVTGNETTLHISIRPSRPRDNGTISLCLWGYSR